MSEVKFNLVDSQSILVGTVHGSIGDLCVAALAAEPETIAELEMALMRFAPEPPNFKSPYSFSDYPAIDDQPYDAGILIIDLAARVVVCNSTYSSPGPQGSVEIHDRQQETEIPVFYRLPDDWLFLSEVECYAWARAEQLARRSPPLDARAILYGRPLLEFLATNLRYGTACCGDDSEAVSHAGAIHAQWLLTPRADLHGLSPREVMLAKLEFIDQDLQFRAFQWSMQLEGPPCLPKDSHAYRYAGFGIHEWVIYYYLVRHLLENANPKACNADFDFEALVEQLDKLKNQWLNSSSNDFDNRIPAVIIDNERKRLPEAMGGRSMVIDEDCPLCKMMGDECEAGREVCFWHLDCCNMENHFAFSTFLTEQEYLDDQKDLQELSRRVDQQMKDGEEQIARGESDEGPGTVSTRQWH
ncbi:MAG TPA: hypothetical protein VI306_17085 [Pyrinomonadaceae bacterium]